MRSNIGVDRFSRFVKRQLKKYKTDRGYFYNIHIEQGKNYVKREMKLRHEKGNFYSPARVFWITIEKITRMRHNEGFIKKKPAKIWFTKT